MSRATDPDQEAVVVVDLASGLEFPTHRAARRWRNQMGQPDHGEATKPTTVSHAEIVAEQAKSVLRCAGCGWPVSDLTIIPETRDVVVRSCDCRLPMDDMPWLFRQFGRESAARGDGPRAQQDNSRAGTDSARVWQGYLSERQADSKIEDLTFSNRPAAVDHVRDLFKRVCGIDVDADQFEHAGDRCLLADPEGRFVGVVVRPRVYDSIEEVEA